MVVEGEGGGEQKERERECTFTQHNLHNKQVCNWFLEQLEFAYRGLYREMINRLAPTKTK